MRYRIEAQEFEGRPDEAYDGSIWLTVNGTDCGRISQGAMTLLGVVNVAPKVTLTPLPQSGYCPWTVLLNDGSLAAAFRTAEEARFYITARYPNHDLVVEDDPF